MLLSRKATATMRRSTHRTILFVSPHLDDVAFSCGGTLVAAQRADCSVVLCTVFTANVVPPSGFALQCQIEKGIPIGVDYMELRRDEDLAFAHLAGICDSIWLDFVEAPNRGYRSSEELFMSIRHEDTQIFNEITQCLREILLGECVAELYAPAANGGHADHCLARAAVMRALMGLTETPSVYFYEELPYAIGRNAAAWVPEANWTPTLRDISSVLEEKLQGAACYTSQLGFQFGGLSEMRTRLRVHAETRAVERGFKGAAELFWKATFLKESDEK